MKRDTTQFMGIKESTDMERKLKRIVWKRNTKGNRAREYQLGTMGDDGEGERKHEL